MKKIFLILAVSFLTITNSNAQKFAYVDTDYILNKIPEFRQAQDKLDAISADWQKEIENKYADVEQMYRAYQQEQVLLTDEMKTKREEAIIKKETGAKNLQQKYFGPEGDLYAKRHTGYFYKTIIKGFRNDLCDKTFDTYLEKYKV